MGKNKQTSRRKLAQLASAILCNAHFGGFASGNIYKGSLKGLCAPGLNCYSCPGALASCPLGALQSALSELRFKLPLYVAGVLVIFGVLFGRAVCAYLCPFGLVQELLHRIPSPKIKKNRLTRLLSLAKYAVLAVFVLAVPLYGAISSGFALPAFCKYICPAGTLTGGIPLVLGSELLRSSAGALFGWKTAVLAAVVVCSVFMYRFFCRFLCPLGAIYSLFNRWAVFGISVDAAKCTKCTKCGRSCKMDALLANDRECIRCGECRHLCPTGAIACAPPKADKADKKGGNYNKWEVK